MRCIRCKKEVYCRGDFRGWLVVTVDGVRKVVENDMHNIGFFDEAKNMVWVKHDFIGLCPDCQLPSEVVGCKDNLQNEGPLPIPDGETRSYAQWLDNIDDRMKFLERCRKEHYNMLHQHEHDIETLGGCLAAMEKRTAKLEREMDRVWEIIRFIGGGK